MQAEKYILAVDQGTSGSKAIIFDSAGRICFEGRSPLRSYFPAEGLVEQEPDEIFESVIAAVREAVGKFSAAGHDAGEISCCGISNQRETFVLWDERGKPLTPAVVWQCRRSVSVCRRLIKEGNSGFIRERTGLFIDPYFSGTKILSLMENPAILQKINAGQAFFGTVDSWLLYRLTGGRSYKTDYTNASRTMLFNLKDLRWDDEILRLFELEKLNLPEALPSGSDFGESSFENIFEKPLPITSMIGDSHAAAFGERCFEKGSAKATMGTGSSILLNTGDLVAPGNTSMVSTICWSTEEQTAYALEGIIVSCGSTLSWLGEQLGLFSSISEAAEIAENTETSGSVVLIPAFSGLGAPWWKMSQQAAIRGLTFESGRNQIIRAGFESIIFQVTDVLKAMEKDLNHPLKSIQIDGGVSDSSMIMHSIAGLNSARIIKCRLREASALGAALMAGLKAGIFNTIANLENLKYNDEEITGNYFHPELSEKYNRWVEILKGLD